MENNTRKLKGKKIKERLYRIIAMFFVITTVLLGVASGVKPDVKYSEEENRMLAEMPEFTKENILNKKVMNGLESYTSDQFILRDFWIKMKVQFDLLLGKREFNGVYLGKDEHLMQVPTAPDMKNVNANLKAMSQFAKRHPEVTMNALIAPNAAYVLKDWLPKGAPVRDQGKDLAYIQKHLPKSMGVIDVTKTLQQHAKEGMYYKTDHHWTTKAALYSFQKAAPQMGIEKPLEHYTKYLVTDSFSGTLASKSGYHKTEDQIEVYAPEGTEVQYLVNDTENREKRATVYDRKALRNKDKYEVFFGGNHAMVQITTANNTTKKLLVVKDSYANSFVPFLIPYYNEIVMVDPRYYYENIDTLINNKNITDVLFLYNMDTFLNDNSIEGVFKNEAE